MADPIAAVGHVMAAPTAATLLAGLAAQNVPVCVGGGWAVDALLGRETRSHTDLDLWAPASQLEVLFAALAAAGVDRILPFPGDRPWNFVLHDGALRRVDLHLYEPLDDETLHYGSHLSGQTFPAAALAGAGTIAGVPVRCESAEWSLRWHVGYPAREVDHYDMRLLCQHFGLTLPETLTAKAT
jgi:lincosamide nucleotidyltransferase A/C/D/E